MTPSLHLSRDRRFKKLLESGPVKLTKRRKNIYLNLCASIMSQQLSVKVADIIYKRFIALYDGEPSAQDIVDTAFDRLRGIGLSNAKTQYVQNVARFELEHGMDFKKLNRMSDAEIIVYLTQIKGVGRWTVEMLLIFTMGREDVFAFDDLGIQQAMIRLYKIENTDKKTLRAEMERVSSKWAPYRSYACVYLWKWKDG